MWTNILLLLFIPINVFCGLNKGTQDPENFGPYEFLIAMKGYCKGPKIRDEAINKFEFVKQQNGRFVNHANMTFLNTTRLAEIRSIISVVTDDGKKKDVLWRYKVDKPCQHFFYGIAIEKFLDSDNCVIKKVKRIYKDEELKTRYLCTITDYAKKTNAFGSYIFDTNVSEMAQQLFGKSFFYGLYHMKTTITSKTGNIVCLLLHLEFKKKID